MTNTMNRKITTTGTNNKKTRVTVSAGVDKSRSGLETDTTKSSNTGPDSGTAQPHHVPDEGCSVPLRNYNGFPIPAIQASRSFALPDRSSAWQHHP